MSMKRVLVSASLCGGIWFTSGCANSYQQNSSHVDTKPNYMRTSPYMDMNDAEECARQLIDDCLARRVIGQNWTDAFRAEEGRAPFI